MPDMDAADVKRLAKSTKKADLELRFLNAWRLAYPTLPVPEQQWKFHPERRWKFDFAFPLVKLAVEIQGGSFGGGRHNRAGGQAKDYEKQREAIRHGWRVLPFNSLDCKDMVAVVDCVAEILTNAQPVSGATR